MEDKPTLRMIKRTIRRREEIIEYLFATREDILGWLRGERGSAGFLFRNGSPPRGN